MYVMLGQAEAELLGNIFQCTLCYGIKKSCVLRLVFSKVLFVENVLLCKNDYYDHVFDQNVPGNNSSNSSANFYVRL